MKKLDLSYWASKYDKPVEADLAAVSDAFHSNSGEGNGFNDKEKELLAEILLASHKIIKDDKAFIDAYEVCERFNQHFAVEPLFFSDISGHLGVWRYDYRAFIKEIPDKYCRLAITNTYTRLGYSLEEEDHLKIGASNNIYDYFLSSLLEEAGDLRVIDVDYKQDPLQFADASYLNLFIMFGKLGLEGRNAFHTLASIGEVSKSAQGYKFIIPKAAQIKMKEEAAFRSRGRMYPTFYEVATVLEV